MSTFTVKVEVPAELKKFGCTPENIQREVPTMLVLKHFREGTISSGKAAKMLSMSRYDFIELLGREGIPIFNPTEEELVNEFNMAKELASQKP